MIRNNFDLTDCKFKLFFKLFPITKNVITRYYNGCIYDRDNTLLTYRTCLTEDTNSVPFTIYRSIAACIVSSNELVVLDCLENSKQYEKRRETFPCVRGLSFVLFRRFSEILTFGSC